MLIDFKDEDFDNKIKNEDKASEQSTEQTDSLEKKEEKTR